MPGVCLEASGGAIHACVLQPPQSFPQVVIEPGQVCRLEACSRSLARSQATLHGTLTERCRRPSAGSLFDASCVPATAIARHRSPATHPWCEPRQEAIRPALGRGSRVRLMGPSARVLAQVGQWCCPNHGMSRGARGAAVSAAWTGTPAGTARHPMESKGGGSGDCTFSACGRARLNRIRIFAAANTSNRLRPGARRRDHLRARHRGSDRRPHASGPALRH